MNTQPTLQTVERAIAFLEFVAASPEAPNVKDVSEALELNITTCYHLLRTLVSSEYIRKSVDGKLTIGEGVKRLYRNYHQSLSPESYLYGITKQLTSATHETSFLSLREGDSVVLKVLEEGTHRLRVSGLYVGMRGHEYNRAAGKAVLAHLKPAERHKMLKASLSGKSKDQHKAIIDSLEVELADTAERGWYLDDGQNEDGISAIAVPIFDANGDVVGAVGLVVPTFRVKRSEESLLEAVIAAATEANRLLGEAAAA